MAEATLKLLLLGEDRSAGRTLKGVGDQSDRTRSKLQGVASVAGKALAGGFLLAGAAAVKLTRGAAEDEKAQAILANTMRKAAGATDAQVKSTEDWISAQEKAYGVSDDDLRPALGKLVAATHDVGKAQRLASLAMDISAGSGKSLEAVSAALGKAQNGNVGALSRLGIKVKDTTKDTAALQSAQLSAKAAQKAYTDAVAKHGKTSDEAKTAAAKLRLAEMHLSDAQGKTKTTTVNAHEAMKRLAETYGGAASKAAETTEGKQKRLNVALSEAGEDIGYKLLPVMLKLTDAATAALDWMTEHPKQMKLIASAVGVAAGVMAVFIAAMKVATIIGKIQAATTAAQAVAAGTATDAQIGLNAAMRANMIGLIVTALVLLVAGLVVAYQKSETFRDIVKGVFHVVGSAASGMWDACRAAFKFIVDAFLTVVGALIHGAAKAFGWVPGIGGKLRTAAAAFDDFRDSVNDSLDGIHKHVDVYVKIHADNLVLQRGPGGLPIYNVQPPKHAVGTRFFAGGPTFLNERGPELVDLPRGSRVYTAAESERMMSGGSGGGDLGTLTLVVKSDTGQVIEQKLVKFQRDQGGRPLAFVSG